jgi:5-formyltetrahydrofolate cyclo-ligase
MKVQIGDEYPKSSAAMTTQTMKQGIRQSIIAARQKMAAAERNEYSREITLRILNLHPYKSAACVLGYMSFGAEFATGAWVQQALQDGKQVLLPRVNSSTKQLELYRVGDLQHDVAPGLWDIPEPLPARCMRFDAVEQVDFILLPGVAFARDGARLGYGGGFYDKLLARIDQGEGKPALVAAAFSMQLVKEIPQEATDRKVEWLLTENEVIDCGKEQSRRAN